MLNLKIYFSELLICLYFFNLIPSSIGVCDADSWTCDDGSCITSDLLCDGAIDCSDGSDETAVSCLIQYCPGYAFRCAYGGCVAKRSQCNGKRDCADGSDETLLLCGTDEEKQDYLTRLQGSCNTDQIECKFNGVCIDRYDTCDGYKHCPDGLDETVELCSATDPCPSYAFRCGYGGCISGKAKCNGTVECWDYSDEAWNLCDTPRIPTPALFTIANAKQPTTTEKTTTTSATIATPTTSKVILSSESCKISFPKIARTIEGKRYIDLIPKYEFFLVGCEDGYTLEPRSLKKAFCNGTQIIPSFECQKYCPAKPIFKDFSTKPTCKVESQTIDCDRNLIRPNTIVFFECLYFFKVSTELTPRKCTETGDWDGVRQGCIMDCGYTFYSRPFSRKGIETNSESVPWNVAIYAKFDEVNYDYTCSGSIISPIIVITAAHCVYDRATKIPFEAEIFRVVPEKESREYEVTQPGIQVTRIHIREDFNYTQEFQNDMALLVLKEHLYFSINVRPVCLHGRKHRGDAEQVSNIIGTLAGYSQETLKLEQIEVIQYSYAECKKRRSGNLLSAEKFCLHSTIGTACRGDSGSGYVHKEGQQYYLYGILSHAPTDASDCAIDDLLVVNVFYFLDWIHSIKSNEHYEYYG